jgi:HAE1 family hydrophobic/amphiphilic exporter-1
VDLDSSAKPDKPVIALEVKRDAARTWGFPWQLAASLRTLVAGTTVGNWRAPDDQTYDVNVRLAPEARNPTRPGAPALCPGRNADGSTRIVRLEPGGPRDGVHRRQPDQPP